MIQIQIPADTSSWHPDAVSALVTLGVLRWGRTLFDMISFALVPPSGVACRTSHNMDKSDFTVPHQPT